MQKFSSLIIVCIIALGSCNSDKKQENSSDNSNEETTSILPVTEFLKGQLREADSLPVTPLKIVSYNGKSDSAWLKRDSIRVFATPFLNPVIDSASMSAYFSGKSFLDQTTNAFTFSFDPKTKLPDSLKLTHWDVYVDPERGTIKRIYIVKEEKKDGADVTSQLTWQTDKWCSIRIITQSAGKEPQIKEEKLIWNFD